MDRHNAQADYDPNASVQAEWVSSAKGNADDSTNRQAIRRKAAHASDVAGRVQEWLQPECVCQGERVAESVRVRAQPAAQPDRIALNVAAGLRIVVAVVVVVEPRLGVEVLARQYSDRPLPQRAAFKGTGARSRLLRIDADLRDPSP
jgi:hypothetical protein